jgi:hypothetical protein
MIINMLTRYNVQHIGIDGSGIGEAVYQLVKKLPGGGVLPVLASQQAHAGTEDAATGSRRSWEYDRGEYDLITAFSAVRKVVTPGGVITYDTDRAAA